MQFEVRSKKAAAASPSTCLSYESSVVELTGAIVRKIFTDAQNRPETYWVFELSRQICVKHDPKEPDLNYAQKDVGLIQLVFLGQKMYVTYKDFLGKTVIAKGKLVFWNFSTAPPACFADCQYV